MSRKEPAMCQKRLPTILRLLLSIFVVCSALAAVTMITSTSVFAVGPEPKWGLPFRNYTSVSIGPNRLHDDNYSAITDDTSGQLYTLNGAGSVTNASLDLLLEPEMNAPGSTSLVPAVALANGTVLAVQKICHVVLIDYNNGWWGEYVHMDNIQVTSGQSVNVNTNIGYPSMNTTPSCKDHTTALHIHFAFLNKVSKFVGKYIPMTNRVLCGHAVTSTGHLNGLADPYFVVPNCKTQDAAGSNLWVTGHDADYHCTLLTNPNDPTNWVSNQCHYLQVAINFATRGPFRGSTILVLDHGTELATSIMNAYGTACTGTKCAAPKFKVDDPRTQFASEPLLDSKGHPLFSAIVVASDITCGGCDNNNAVGDTPDSNTINARSSDIKKFYNAGGGILALAGANNSNIFYNFVPIPTIASNNVNPPFSLTSVGLSLGLLEGLGASDDNCCVTHNTFAIPGPLSLFQIAENDNSGSGFPETLIVEAGFAP